jgi:hypothetical protein
MAAKEANTPSAAVNAAFHRTNAHHCRANSPCNELCGHASPPCTELCDPTARRGARLHRLRAALLLAAAGPATAAADAAEPANSTVSAAPVATAAGAAGAASAAAAQPALSGTARSRPGP